MRYSLRKKTAAYIVASTILVFFIGFGLCSVFASRYYLAQKQLGMFSVYQNISDIYSGNYSDLYNTYTNDKYTALSKLCEEAGFSMIIVSPSGKSKFAYGNSDILYSRLSKLTFLRDVENTDIIYSCNDYIIQTSMDSYGNIEYLEMWGFLYDGSSFICRCSYSGVQNSINLILRFYFIICIIVLFIIAFIMLLVMKSLTQPLKDLVKVIQEANEGNFEARFTSKHKRNDEIDVLGQNISEMTEKLEKTVSELKSSNINLQNELKAKEKLEEARKKYMSDVSHELKTPIALISGYAEGLKEGISDSPEDRDYYCDVIIDEADKMNTLVKRLSTLNQLEQGKSAVNMERFNVVEVIDGFLNTMSMIIEEKEAEICFDNRDSVYVWSDEFLFEEVLVNYFNNALNHLNEKKKISINVECLGPDVRVTVFNSGSNIAKEELDRIWDKFYKVDKARTREYGGSGLGLSIVKAIADSLNKECGVYNTAEGVAFYIDLESAGEQHKVTDNEAKEDLLKIKFSELPLWKGLKKK